MAGCNWIVSLINQVDLQLQDHGYARSLARFAANLGPVVWRIASKRIRSILPSGTNFGPGWVGEEEILKRAQFPVSQRQNAPLPYDPPSSTSSPVALNFVAEDIQGNRRLVSQGRFTSPSSGSGDVKSISQANMNCPSGNMGTVMQNIPSPMPAPCEAPVHPEAPGMVSRNLGAIQAVPSNYDESTNISASGSRLPPINSLRSHEPSSEELSWNWLVHHHGPTLPDTNARIPVQTTLNSCFLVSPQQRDLGLQL